MSLKFFYDQHETMILYDKLVLLSNTTSIRNVGA
jgi:hypothetical protein